MHLAQVTPTLKESVSPTTQGTLARVPQVIQGRGGESRESGIQGAGGDSWAGGGDSCKKGILPCSVIIIFDRANARCLSEFRIIDDDECWQLVVGNGDR